MFLSENSKEGYATLEGDKIIQESIVEAGYEIDRAVLSELNIVKLDRHAKRNRVISQATKVIAKEVNDPLYAKLKKLNAARMKIKKQIEKKYESKAKQRAQKLMSGMGVKTNDLPNR
jgi:inorganic pyrophosphatase